MATVHDVAAYILKKQGKMTAIKLQKLVYYSQAWSLVWDDRPIFKDKIEAWANGPVVRSLYNHYKGHFEVKNSIGDPNDLTRAEKDTVDAIVKHYGDKTSHYLSELTHLEAPWREARRGVAPGQPSSNVITHSAMAEYYGGLV